MSKIRRRLIGFGALLCELIVLAMFYSTTLLDPFPFDRVRVSLIFGTGVVSAMFAYVASRSFQDRATDGTAKGKQLILKPPFLIWTVAVAFTTMQLASGLMMVYLANKK